MSAAQEEERGLSGEKMRLLADTKADLFKRQLSNAENYDRAILSLSVAFLGVSLTFLKDFVPVHLARWPLLLHFSWWAFIFAILVTLLSYLMSQRAITEQLEKAEEYYLHDKAEARKRSLSARATDWLNVASGACFMLGILLTTVFVTVNVEGASKMSRDKKAEQVRATEGAPIPKIQEATVKKGAPIPDLQQAPQQGQTPNPAQNQQPAQGNPGQQESGASEPAGTNK